MKDIAIYFTNLIQAFKAGETVAKQQFFQGIGENCVTMYLATLAEKASCEQGPAPEGIKKGVCSHFIKQLCHRGLLPNNLTDVEIEAMVEGKRTEFMFHVINRIYRDSSVLRTPIDLLDHSAAMGTMDWVLQELEKNNV